MVADAGEDAEKGEYLLIAVGVETSTTSMEISVEIPQKVENQFTTTFNYSTLRHIPKVVYILQLFSFLLIADLFIISTNCQEPRCSSLDE